MRHQRLAEQRLLDHALGRRDGAFLAAGQHVALGRQRLELGLAERGQAIQVRVALIFQCLK